MNYSALQRASLDELIVETAMNQDFVRNPEKDFTRMRKLNFSDTFRSILEMGGNSLNVELRKLFKGHTRPTASAFVQARHKLLPAAFEHVFHKYTKRLNHPKLFRGFRLIGVDGTRLPIFTNSYDEETVLHSSNKKDSNSLHVSASFDILNDIFTDVVIQPFRQMDERGALIEMIRSYKENDIVIADRNYESYNIFAYLSENNLKYVIRVKDIHSNGILGGLELPDTEFDTSITVHVSNYQNKSLKQLPNYRFSPSSARFDFSTKEQPVYSLTLRIVRVQLKNGKYVSMITNLGDDFSLEDMKDLYAMRWTEETAFNELKYSVGLRNLHAKKKDSVYQEIFAKLILYNFCKSIVNHTKLPIRTTKNKRQINFKMAVVICREYLMEQNTVSSYIEAELIRYTLPIRPNRSFDRTVLPKGFSSFNYRVA